MTDERPERMTPAVLTRIAEWSAGEWEDCPGWMLDDLLAEATRARASELEWKAKAEALKAENRRAGAAIAAAEARAEELRAALETVGAKWLDEWLNCPLCDSEIQIWKGEVLTGPHPHNEGCLLAAPPRKTAK